MAAIGCENPVKEYYNYLIEKGTEGHNARNAVARHIARISYGIMKTNEKYEPYKWRKSSKTDKK
jgi:hypothetical protein